jgi:tRNA-specific 2-thiouridylase
MSERVVVAMSGGVDSSVAAALLAEAGYEVIGVTLRLSREGSRCCSLEDAADARRVADRLGIRFYVADYAEAFRREVMEPWADAYLAGQTPIPCVACNQRFKFRHLLDRARALGATSVATGHFARIELDGATGARTLHRGTDAAKDQSYFLFDLSPAQLAAIRFPVGGLTKVAVREHARRLGLATADKAESQEICFVPDGDTAGAVERIRPGRAPGAGPIVDEHQRPIGEHRGIHCYTVGQRRGLGVARGERLFVRAIDAAANRVQVAPLDRLGATGAVLHGGAWIAGAAPAAAIQARVHVRYRHVGVTAKIEPAPGQSARVLFDAPVVAVAPGQAAVFYDGDCVLGGGWIAEALA